MFGGCHQPGTGFIWNAGLGPLLKRCDERALRKILRKTHVARDASEARDESGGFYPPDCIDRAMGIRGHFRKWVTTIVREEHLRGRTLGKSRPDPLRRPARSVLRIQPLLPLILLRSVQSQRLLL